MRTTVTVAATPMRCAGTWTNQPFAIDATEEVYESTCPVGTTGQVRRWHVCQASGSWGPTSQSDNCAAILAAPADVRTSNVSNGVQITWAAVSGATEYRIYKGNSNSVYRTVFPTSHIDDVVTPGSTYSYAVAAYSNQNNQSVTSPLSAWSTIVYRQTQQELLPPTNVLAAQYISSNRRAIRLSWGAAPSPVDSYYIYRRDRNGVLAMLGGSDASFVDWPELNLVSGTSYCYYIRSVKNGATSVESNEGCAIAP